MVFPVSDKFYVGEGFSIAIYMYVLQINPKPGVRRVGTTKRNNFGQRPYSATVLFDHTLGS